MGVSDEVYNANRSIIIRVFCESRIRDEEEYQKSGELLKGELNLVLLPGIETVCLTPPPSTENNKELLLLTRGITSVYRTISSLSTHHYQESSINWKNSRLLHLLHDAIQPTSFTSLICLIFPTIHHRETSYTTLSFAHRLHKIQQTPVPCHVIDKDIVMEYLMRQLQSVENTLQEREVDLN